MASNLVLLCAVGVAGCFYLAESAFTGETCQTGAECLAQAKHDRSLLQTSAETAKLAKNAKSDPEEEKMPEEVQSKDVSTCEEDIFARPELCPAKCPFAAEMRDKFCHFRCVQKEECGLKGTVENATIPDKELMTCRHCEVEGCAKCVPAKPGAQGERFESCEKCMPGYSLTEEGECQMKGLGVFIAIAVVGALLAVVAVAYYFSVRAKPCVNPEGVEHGLKGRDAMRLKPTGSSEPWPITTNLMTTNVAGPGTMALFRYQTAIIVWASVLLAVWLGFAIFVSSDLLILGTRAADSPQLLCAVVKWGHHRQLELIWTKVTWLVFAYVFSFLGAIVYGIYQTKLFDRENSEDATMPSFAAILDGLPKLSGKDLVEQKLKTAVKDATGIDPVGVSVAWDYSRKKHEVEQILEAEFEEALGHSGHESHEPTPELGLWGKTEAYVTNLVLNAWHVHLDHDQHRMNAQDVKSMLNDIETTSSAFVVFPTHEAKARALEATTSQKVMVDGVACTMRPSVYAPEGLFWHNFQVTPEERSGKMFMSTLFLFLACAAWTFLLYIPYAFYMGSFSYANGDEPGEFSESLFICLVVGSQIGLFVVSSMGAKNCQFRTEDEQQKAYMMFYNGALVLNLIMDIALQTYLSYLQMVGVGAHTSDGRLLGSLGSIQEVFESYPIQKTVGKLLFKYCWPCTFLVPFLAEPFVAQWLPWHFGQMLVGANKKIKGENAEKALELGEMEQGRYADCIFNAILVVCIPFISPAYMAMTFGALIISHVYIYMYDQVKTLRYVVKFNFSGPEVHWLGMQLFAIPCSILAAGMVFKMNQMSGGEQLGSGLLQGYQLGGACFGAMVGHFILHLAVLEYFVKGFGESTKAENASYAEAAKSNPATHFSTNPIHCLRSKYVLNHKVPQIKYAAGKEHLMKVNPEIGAYYQTEGK